MTNWRSEEGRRAADLEVVINEQSKTYHVNLRSVSRCSDFFFNIATRSPKLQLSDAFPTLPGPERSDFHVKLSDGAAFRIGRIETSVGELRGDVAQALGRGGTTLRLFVQRGQGDQVELDEDWRMVEGFGMKRGDSVCVVLHDSWYHFDEEEAS